MLAPILEAAARKKMYQHIFTEMMQTDKEKSLPSVCVSLNDLKLRVRYQQSDTIQQNVTYNSDYMCIAIHRVGTAMRSKYHWILLKIILYLVMDNDGRHETDD